VKHHCNFGLVEVCADCHVKLHDNRMDVLKDDGEVKFVARAEYPTKYFSVEDIAVKVDWTHRRIWVWHDGRERFKQYGRVSLREAVRDILAEAGRERYLDRVLEEYGVQPDSY